LALLGFSKNLWGIHRMVFDVTQTIRRRVETSMVYQTQASTGTEILRNENSSPLICCKDTRDRSISIFRG
jgi:hypothetical protein